MRQQEIVPAAGDTPRPVEVVNLPFSRSNPYQRLIYTGLEGRYRPVAGHRADILDLERLAHGTGRRILHLHWDDRLFGRSRDRDANRAQAEAALDGLERFRESGGRLLWTIHNRKPHREIDRETFLWARARLVRLADRIHVHAPHAAEHMVERYRADPGIIRIVPIPSYLDAYEPAERTLAREVDFDRPREILFFGIIRREKGAEALVKAARRLARQGHEYRLRVIGKAHARMRARLGDAGADAPIEIRTDRVPDAEVPEILAAAHVFAAPYSSLFSTSSVMLAMTYGLPVVGPALRELRETVPGPCRSLLYDPAAPRGLLRALKDVVRMPAEELAAHRAACRAFAEARAPTRIGAQLGAVLDELA